MSDVEIQSEQQSKSPSLIVLAVIIFVMGGLLGWVIGRQSALQGDDSVIIEANQLPTAAAPRIEPETTVNNVAEPIRPTPANISPETIKTLGDPSAPVTIVEFSDYQCPFCLRYSQETFPQLKSEFIDTGRVFYVFKDFPIASLHPLAYRLHEAALCASEAGGTETYWEAHDLFFGQSDIFQVNSLAEMDAIILAEMDRVGIKAEGIAECLQDNRYTKTVQTGIDEGRSLGVSGTPTFFVNGYPLVGAQPYQVFQQVINLAEEGKLAEAFQANTEPTAGPPAQPDQPVAVPLSDEPVKGDPNAPVTIVEYSDYQCPFCLRHFNNTMPLLQQYIDAGQVQYVFKDFPIHSIHPQAQKAHEAARCARELGGDDAYWTMHDLLFVNQEAWAQTALPNHVAVFKSLAGEAGLPQVEFDTCLGSDKYYDAVNAELNEGAQLGVRGTPAFFINGRFVSGAQPFSVFQQVIEPLLNQQ
jgi:protein-disulfide isomerase